MSSYKTRRGDHKYLIVYNDNWVESVNCLTVEEAVLHAMRVAKSDNILRFKIHAVWTPKHVKRGTQWKEYENSNYLNDNRHQIVVDMAYLPRGDSDLCDAA